MGRLVDVDEIKKMFDPRTWQGEMMIAVAETIPTAYDVDEVVKELEDLIQRCCYCRESCNEKCLIERTIEIVKGGGMNESNNTL